MLLDIPKQAVPVRQIKTADDRANFTKIIGQSPRALAMLGFVGKAAATDASVLLEGESGTGKELVGQAIHYASARAAGPFVAVNCGALNANLIESELFGHEKGAFTGAIAQRLGRFERAKGGTLLLDEIGDLPLQAQATLLRALQERRIERVGGVKEIEIDIRVMAATNHNLWAEVEAGTFRRDLYFRLAVMTITLPPLRDRRDDIILLAQHFLTLHSGRLSRRPPSLTPTAEAVLLEYDWPGNIRELGNVIECALTLEGGEEINAESLISQIKRRPQLISVQENHHSHEFNGTPLAAGAKLDDLALPERRELIKWALRQRHGNRVDAAKLLGLSSRFQLYRLMKKLGVSGAVKD